MERIECVRQVLDLHVRPALWEHGGDVEIASLDDAGNLTLRMRGQCAGCPGAIAVTLPEMEGTLREQLPWLDRVELASPVSDDLLAFARQLLGGGPDAAVRA